MDSRTLSRGMSGFMWISRSITSMGCRFCRDAGAAIAARTCLPHAATSAPHTATALPLLPRTLLRHTTHYTLLHTPPATHYTVSARRGWWAAGTCAARGANAPRLLPDIAHLFARTRLLRAVALITCAPAVRLLSFLAGCLRARWHPPCICGHSIVPRGAVTPIGSCDDTWR